MLSDLFGKVEKLTVKIAKNLNKREQSIQQKAISHKLFFNGRNSIFFSILVIPMLSLVSPTNTGSVGPYLDGVFSETAPGDAGAWSVEDAYPDVNIASPLRILPFPNTTDYLVLSKVGEIWQLSLETQERKLILDIKDRTFKLGEGGTVGMALHPEFGNVAEPDKQIVFVFYRTKPDADDWDEKGFNRLSKFTWDAETNQFDVNSEEVLFQQFDRSTWHNGGGMFFGPDGFLYLSLGDEGRDEQKAVSTQRLDGGLFSGLIRIDVDNDPEKSHPIIRQPIANAVAPSNWGDTYSQGYSIPNDNPWLSPDGSHLEEFYALGIRSPYSTFYDEIEDKIWVLDVGSEFREEFSILEREDNLQWPFLEGTIKSENYDKPDNVIGNEKGPIFEYDRSIGSAVIGGGVYRGNKFTSLFGKYLFADYVQTNLMALDYSDINNITFQTLIPNLTNLDVDLPEDPGITGVHILEDGNILITVLGREFTVPGKILLLKQSEILPDPPALLSDLNVFKNLETLEVKDGIIPYNVNAPLWSDRARKQRWMAIPSQNGQQEQIQFKYASNWKFPEGTVFIKHFELPLTTDLEGEYKRLETRFFVIGKNGEGYGLTYKWNEDDSDATLLRVSDSEDFDIWEDGEISFTQTWNYPSRNQCLSCHNKNADYVLGVKTHQLNSNLFYCDIDAETNQLEYLSNRGILSKKLTNASSLIKAHPIDDESIDLELRIRSYLDANCAPCHQTGGVSTVDMDLSFELPVRLHKTINEKTQSLGSDPDNLLIKPGDHTASELWLRDASISDNRMPPISRNLNDEVYLNYLAEWIDGLTEESTDFDNFYPYPNPVSDWLFLSFDENWTLPIEVNIFNVNGQPVHQEMSSESSILHLDLNHLPSGMYILNAHSESGSLTHRFMIM